jgi:hypothetical protein
MPNRDLQWDDATKLNGGIDASFLKNRMSLTLDGFYDYRYNMLTTLSSSVPLTVGAALPSQNFRTVAAFGTEISLGWTDRINKDWSYKVRGFFSWSDNKQIKVDYDQGLKGTYLDPSGRSTDMGFLGLKSMGILRTQADLDALLEKIQPIPFMVKNLRWV